MAIPKLALSIKTAEANELARLNGQGMTKTVTAALRERLTRERMRHGTAASLSTCLTATSHWLRASYDSRPANLKEWDAAAGDEA